MEQLLATLDGKLIELNELNAKHKELQQKQEEVLVDLMKKNRPIAEKIKEEGYYFTHPTLEWRSRRGPILGYVREENLLYVFDLEKGIVEINTRNKEERNTFFRVIVREGLFEEASAGIDYVKEMVDVYLKEMQQVVNGMEIQITKYE